LIASPQAAGLAALILSSPSFYGYNYERGQVARNVKEIIRNLAYERTLNEPPVIWNKVNNYLCLGPQDEGSSPCSRSSTTTSSSTPTPCPQALLTPGFESSWNSALPWEIATGKCCEGVVMAGPVWSHSGKSC
jgi:hypothetical protein